MMVIFSLKKLVDINLEFTFAYVKWRLGFCRLMAELVLTSLSG